MAWYGRIPSGPQGMVWSGPLWAAGGMAWHGRVPSRPPPPCPHRCGWAALHLVALDDLRPVRALSDAGAALSVQSQVRTVHGPLGGQAAGRGGPVPTTVPPLPAGARRCTRLPPEPPPPFSRRCSAPARSRPSRTAASTPQPHGQPLCARADGRATRRINRVGIAPSTRRRWRRRAAAPLAIASPTPATGCANFAHSTSTRSALQSTAAAAALLGRAL
jgi:hypothetical protein